MKVNRNNSKNNTEKTSKDIRNNVLFTDITVEEEVFVRGGARRGSIKQVDRVTL